MTTDSLPISGNDLGIKNTHQSFGCSLIASGALIGVAVGLRFAVAQTAPVQAVDWCLVGAVGLLAVRRMYVGGSVVLAILVDVVGPAAIAGQTSTVRELLLHRRIWTYQHPKGLLGQIYYRIAPSFVFLTPPYRRVIDGLAFHLFSTAAAIGLVAYFGPPAAAVLIVAASALVARLVAVFQTTHGAPNHEPPIETYERLERLTEAGNPLDLYNQLRVSFESWRERGFQNRVIEDLPPSVGGGTGNHFVADLIVETQPIPEPAARGPATALTLSFSAVILEVTGATLLLFLPLIAGEVQAALLLLAAAGLAGWCAANFFNIAQRIHCCFRFRSDVAWIQFEGTSMVNKLAVGGGLLGMPGTEGHSIKSDLQVFLRGARIISECSTTDESQWSRVMGTAHPAQRALQFSPRYLVSAATDQPFSDRLVSVLRASLDFRDDTANLRTPDLQAAGLQGLLAANVEVSRLMNAAAAHGATQGQQLALGQSPLPPALPSAPSPVSGPPRPSVPSPPSPKKPASAPPSQAAPQPATGGNASKPSQTPAAPTSTKPSGTSWINNNITWTCSKCRKQLNAPAQLANKRMVCPGCGDLQPVPSRS